MGATSRKSRTLALVHSQPGPAEPGRRARSALTIGGEGGGRRRLVWGLLIGVGLAFLIAVARQDQGRISPFRADDLGALLTKLGLLLLLGGAAAALFRHRLTAAFEALLFWLLVVLMLAAGYTYRGEMRRLGERLVGSQAAPARPAARGSRVELARGRAGDFPVAASLNGARVATVLDTGASAVVLTQEAAKAAGLPLEVLAYTVAVETANGRTRAAPVTLDRVAVGTIVERSVPALVAQPGQLKTNLLGMSFLNRLESWEVRSDKLVLRAYP